MCEEVFAKLYDIQKVSRFLVKVTEAPHYRRHVAQREWAEQGQKHARGDKVNGLPSQLIRTEGPGHTIGLATQGVNSGNGFLFVSHTGEIFPSGFLPISAGDVRKDKIADVYRTSELFLALRSPEKFKGICGICEFGRICGGSRSRAYALTGDYLETDPWCAYRPAGARTETAPA